VEDVNLRRMICQLFSYYVQRYAQLL